MASLYPGPFCEQLSLCAADLKNNDLHAIAEGSLKNGHVLEFKLFADKSNLTCANVIQWIKILQPQSTASDSTLKYRITNVQDLNKKLNSKKKIKKFKSVKELKTATFDVFEGQKKLSKGHDSHFRLAESRSPHEEIQILKNSETNLTATSPDINCTENESCLTNQNIPESVFKEERKYLNILEHEICKKQKVLRGLQQLVGDEHVNLNKLKSRNGHYAVRNVEKRDARAARHRQQLNEAKVTIFRQEKVIKYYKQKVKKLKKVTHKLKKDTRIIIEHGHEVDRAKRSLLHSEEHNQQLMLENEELKVKLVEQGSSYTKKKHSVNYFKKSLNKLKSGLKTDKTKLLEKELAEKKQEIQNLVSNVECLQEKLVNNFQTKNSNGSFNNSVRLCVIELAGLEVAVEKIPKVIQAVANHLFSRTLDTSDLPTKTTTQSIIDEGHYLAKTFIATKIDSSESFGINRDGTSRKKQKILDTSITLDSGEVMSLGFTRVARETAKVINEVTQRHIQEMADISNPVQSNSEYESDQFIRDTLGKLSFSMSDRASNEKAANQLLEEWKENVLKATSESETSKIKHFYCMAHVLLGFHKYVCDDIKKVEQSVTAQNGPLGRDGLPQFKHWSKSGTVLERVVRTVSETFGPAGDHLGLRDRWEAHCSEHGLKSIVGNYRDNRFNGLFQTSAEVLVHKDDMLAVLKTVQQPNRKLVSVKADLQCPFVETFLHCLGLFFLKVTGPYWNLVTSGVVPYLLLYRHIHTLVQFLQTCSENPLKLLDPEVCWDIENIDIFELPGYHMFEKTLYREPVNKRLFSELAIVVSDAFLRCINKQLVDFLPGGQFSEQPTKDDLSRTSYAHSTNLGCEHHFGDLDSSQKRRPNASLHHHSSIQLLKRNRINMMKWLREMSSSDQNYVLMNARKGGKALRLSHLESEQNVLKEIHKEMTTSEKGKKRKRNVSENLDNDFQVETPPKCFSVGEYVAVAYQDLWYPGIVEQVCDDCLYINFLTSTRQPGHFSWPARKDIQRVSTEFVLKRGFIPECKKSGRLWFVTEYKEISDLYKKYSAIYF